MTEKWTPGEWSLEGTTIYALNEEGANIFQAQVSPGFKDYPRRGKPTKTPIEEVLANAHLIVAAPDLYRALKAAYDFIFDEYYEPNRDDGECLPMVARKPVEEIVNALAKARGEA